jgi:hypothetical protein
MTHSTPLSFEITLCLFKFRRAKGVPHCGVDPKKFQRSIREEAYGPGVFPSESDPRVVNHNLQHATEEHATLIGATLAQPLDCDGQAPIPDEKSTGHYAGRFPQVCLSCSPLDTPSKQNAASEHHQRFHSAPVLHK